MPRTASNPFDYSKITVTDTQAPEGTPERNWIEHPLASHVLDSYDYNQWKTVTVPGSAVGQVRSHLNQIAKAHNIGVKVRPLGANYDKDAKAVEVSFLGKARKGQSSDEDESDPEVNSEVNSADSE